MASYSKSSNIHKIEKILTKLNINESNKHEYIEYVGLSYIKLNVLFYSQVLSKC